MSTDALPRRNLGLGENWGRSVEGRVGALLGKFGQEVQSLHGLGRYSASSAEEFARNALRIEEALLEMPLYFSKSAYSAAPTIGASWTPVAGLSLHVPDGKSTVNLLATANATIPLTGGGEGAAQFAWPFSLDLVTSEYGPRDGGFHEGMDFAGGAASSGNPIPAAGAGVVADSVILHSGWGNYVRLEHDVDGTMMSTLYAHMIAPPSVGVGDVVSLGQTLGYVGNTGASFGDHLHFETWTGTSFGTHADPRWFMGMYGGATTGTPSVAAKMRITIGGVTSIEFSGLMSETLPYAMTYVPVFGRSFVASGSTVSVLLEAAGGSATGTAATLAVTGSFHA